ncbi:MAG: MBL fold metallo-hydrolase [Candidatus Krumholzibacteriota bacterium]|nr:MBL fold metallo-hydrolase [Candidatus Krumholzibacteriota bacterium]
MRKIALFVFVSLLMVSSQVSSQQAGKNPDFASEFVKPTKIGPLTAPENWPMFFDRAPENRVPDGAVSQVLVIGSGNPTANPNRIGPSLAVIVNGYPYFVDAGEGIWRGMAKAALVNGDWVTEAFDINNMKYLFLTHLHEDHTIGIPSWILNPYKFGCRTNKEVYGPKGTAAMFDNILAAWTIDLHEMWEGSLHASKDGSNANCHDLVKDGQIFKDDRVTVSAFRTKHGALQYTFGYRFETPDRVFAFGGDGHYSEGLVKAAKDADILFIESCTLENVKYATWGGETAEEKQKAIGAYHMFPPDLVRVKNESGVKAIVLVHEQFYAPPEEFKRLGLLEEIKRAGLEGPIYSSLDGDVY